MIQKDLICKLQAPSALCFRLLSARMPGEASILSQPSALNSLLLSSNPHTIHPIPIANPLTLSFTGLGDLESSDSASDFLKRHPSDDLQQHRDREHGNPIAMASSQEQGTWEGLRVIRATHSQPSQLVTAQNFLLSETVGGIRGAGTLENVAIQGDSPSRSVPSMSSQWKSYKMACRGMPLGVEPLQSRLAFVEEDHD